MNRRTITFMLFVGLANLIAGVVENVIIDSIDPDAGPLSGRTRVLVRGGPFKGKEREFPRPKCKFGSSTRIVNGTYVRCTKKPYPPGQKEAERADKDDICLQCDIAPAGIKPEIIPVTISLVGDFSDVSNSVHYRYYPDPEVTAIYPRYGKKNGGTYVQVWGKNFLNYDQYLRCAFGTKEVQAHFVSSGYLYCYSPPSDVVTSAMPLSITMNDQQYSNKIDYWYYEFPSIYMLDPNKGPDTGGTHVLLRGNNYNPFYKYPINNYNDTFCRFGQLGIVPTKVLNSTKVICISPPSFVLREVIVEITLNNQEWTQDNNVFHYYRPPFLYYIEPLMGPVAGGTEVHVYGSNFEDTGFVKCKFGEQIVDGKYLNLNELLCVSPPTDTPGYVPFQVAVREDEFSAEDMAQYLYYATPIVHSVEPICGPERGYTHIVIRGENFIDPGFDMVYCLFNNTIAMNTTVFPPDRIECSSPPVLNMKGINEHNVRWYNISISLNKRDITPTNFDFHYYKEVTLKNITPPGGPISGNTTVFISGKGLDRYPACNVTDRFGTFQVLPLKFNDTISIAKSPKVSLPDDVVVSHGINGQQYNPDININHRDPENTYTYYGNPLINEYSPNRGPSSGGTKISFRGFGFEPYKDEEGNPKPKQVWIRMKMADGSNAIKPTQSEYIDPYLIEWKTPPAKEGKYIMEMSLNGQNYFTLPYINGTKYNYVYYPGPHVIELDPAFGPIDPNVDILVSVKGTNFKCPKSKCDHVICRFGEGKGAIYVDGTLISENEIRCMAPKYTRPDVLPVEISLFEDQYTNDGVEFGYYAPFVWKVTPEIVSRKGNTNITIYGYGFVNGTGSALKARYGSVRRHLICRGSCAVRAQYLNKNYLCAKTLPYKDVTYEVSGDHLNNDEFPVEVTVYGGYYTDNNVSIRYFEEPIYGDPIPGSAPENGEELIRIPTDFLTKETNPKNPINDEEILREYSKPKCRFRSIGKKTVETKGIIGHYPLAESEVLNTVYCMSPKWKLAKGEEEEIVALDISINDGADYSGNKRFKITREVSIYRIYPPCGPTYGGTKMTIAGTGLRQYRNPRLRWGVINSIPLNMGLLETLIYDKKTPMTNDQFENDVISMNEEPLIMFEKGVKYELMRSTSPKLPNWDRTHGGQTYLELGHDTDLKTYNSSIFKYYNYGPSHLEYYYYKQPTAKDLWPKAGTTKGGTIVMIRGQWFKYMPEYGVIPYAKFGNQKIRCMFESTVRIICKAPPNSNIRSYMNVEISLNGRDFTDDGLRYHYYYPPIIRDITPKIGPNTGGTIVHLFGEQFTNLSTGTEFMCRFMPVDHSSPAKYIPAVYENETSIICRTPGGWASGVKAYVDLTFNGYEYTDAKKAFHFYAIGKVYPQSGPSDGSGGDMIIEGSGFTDVSNMYCSFDGFRYRPIESSETLIKCPIPRARGGDNFFGSVPLEISINGIDPYKFKHGFHYYPQINCTDFFPRSAPARGKGVIKFYGHGFRADFPQVKPACRFGKYVGKADVLSETELLCHIPEIDEFNQTYMGEVALNEYSYTSAKSGSRFAPYGIYDIDPSSGSLGGHHQIHVYGDGFVTDGKPMCRFGIAGNYATSDGVVISKNRMYCKSPKTFEVPSASELPLAVPFSISFFDEKINPWTGNSYRQAAKIDEIRFDPWTTSGQIYRFYKQPMIERIDPNSANVGEIIDVYVYASTSTPFVEPISPIGLDDTEAGIICKFGRFGTSAGEYINKTTLKCVTPSTKENPKNVMKEVVNLEVAMNGYDFTSDNDNTLFTFFGTGKLFNYWPYIIGIILAILAIIGLIMLISQYCQEEEKKQEPVVEEAVGRRKRKEPTELGLRPHTLRDEYGLYRSRAVHGDVNASPNADQNVRQSMMYPRNSRRSPRQSNRQSNRDDMGRSNFQSNMNRQGPNQQDRIDQNLLFQS